MKKYILITTLMMAMTAATTVQAFIPVNGGGSQTGKVVQPDFSVCTWNVWIYHPEQNSAADVKSFLAPYVRIKNTWTLETGNILMEAKFKAGQYSSPEAARSAAQSVVNALKNDLGVYAVCQADHFNPHPRLSGGN